MQAFPFDSELTYDDHDNPVYDRAVSSQPLRKLIKELFSTGVMPNPSNNLQVSAGTDGMTVQVATGFAVIEGGLCHETETRTLEVTAADNTYDRIDSVVLRWNENVEVRTADLYIVAGTPAVNPVRPTLQRNNSVYEIGLADVFITKRVATITNDKITDTRYEAERCGIVSSVSEWDTSNIYQQVQDDLARFKNTEQAEFLSWFASIEDILDENAAAHLQSEINTINTTLEELDAAHISFSDTIAQTGATNVQGAIEALKTAFSSALTALKNTAIAQAVGATGTTFTSVINKLGEIVNRGNVSQTLSPNSSYTIPQGYHAGGGIVTAIANTDTFSVTSNGTHDMGISNLNRYLNVNVPIDPSRVSIQRVSNIEAGNYYIVVVQTGINDRPVEPTISGATVLESYSNNATSDGFGHYCWTKVFKVYATTNNITTNGNTFILSIS